MQTHTSTRPRGGPKPAGRTHANPKANTPAADQSILLLCTGRDQSQEIGLLAYHLWEASGRPAGQDMHFWLQAENQLLGSCNQDVGSIKRAPSPKRRSAPVLRQAAPLRASA